MNEAYFGMQINIEVFCTINNYGCFLVMSYLVKKKKKNEAELMFLFNVGVSHLVNKLYLVSTKNLLVS